MVERERLSEGNANLLWCFGLGLRKTNEEKTVFISSTAFCRLDRLLEGNASSECCGGIKFGDLETVLDRRSLKDTFRLNAENAVADLDLDVCALDTWELHVKLETIRMTRKVDLAFHASVDESVLDTLHRLLLSRRLRYIRTEKAIALLLVLVVVVVADFLPTSWC